MRSRPEKARDFVSGGAGRDVIFAGAGDDQVLAGADNDIVYGDAGADRIFGDQGNDLITAGAGDDTVFGGAGDDLIVAEVGDGNDVYFGDEGGGGTGIDTLDMSAATANVTVNLGSGAVVERHARRVPRLVTTRSGESRTSIPAPATTPSPRATRST